MKVVSQVDLAVVVKITNRYLKEMANAGCTGVELLVGVGLLILQLETASNGGADGKRILREIESILEQLPKIIADTKEGGFSE